ncbi:hypothetical protein [Paracoccus sp. (in: a-proteobacteria)]|uniref:hypothetical protein n=1 Tax=Paracoccus sp. TaxID=267 RepID=UPI0026DEAFDD|nr:hypothetical protein [Paracoccus sp. (in: a-proteobacteria)]MDO5647636.1 hypothetical protein [Paracoccus sp. (in: a-proteobacteria)]
MRRQDDAAWPNLLRRSWFLSAVDHVNLDRLRYRVMTAMDDLFREVDILIGPALTGPMLVASNFTGHPCLQLRTGFAKRPVTGDETGAETRPVPQGLSLWAGLFNESVLMPFATLLEEKRAVAGKRPDL